MGVLTTADLDAIAARISEIGMAMSGDMVNAGVIRTRVKDLLVTADDSPGCEGVYKYLDEFRGYHRWKHETLNYWIHWNDGDPCWVIDTTPDDTGDGGLLEWRSNNDVLISNYFPLGGLSGNPVVSEITASYYATEIDVLTPAETAALVAAIRSGLALESSVSSVLSAVQNVQNNTFIAANIPGILQVPAAGNPQTVTITLAISDETGAAHDIDSSANPAVVLVNNAGTDRSGRLAAWSHPSTGKYTSTYTNTVGDAIEGLFWEITATVNAKLRRYVATTQLVNTIAVDFTATDRQMLSGLVEAVFAIPTTSPPSAETNASTTAAAILLDPTKKIGTNANNQVLTPSLNASQTTGVFPAEVVANTGGGLTDDQAAMQIAIKAKTDLIVASVIKVISAFTAGGNVLTIWANTDYNAEKSQVINIPPANYVPDVGATIKLHITDIESDEDISVIEGLGIDNEGLYRFEPKQKDTTKLLRGGVGKYQFAVKAHYPSEIIGRVIGCCVIFK